MKVLFDTNIVLDIALNRKPFVEQAALLWRLAEQKEIMACLSNTSEQSGTGSRFILSRLHEVEAEENVRIVYAGESGSRGWGFPLRVWTVNAGQKSRRWIESSPLIAFFD